MLKYYHVRYPGISAFLSPNDCCLKKGLWYLQGTPIMFRSRSGQYMCTEVDQDLLATFLRSRGQQQANERPHRHGHSGKENVVANSSLDDEGNSTDFLVFMLTFLCM